MTAKKKNSKAIDKTDTQKAPDNAASKEEPNKAEEFQMEPVDSSRIKARGYNKETQVCRLEFVKGGIYDYHNFANQLWMAFQVSPSPGTFFENFIKQGHGIEVKKIS